VEETAFSRLGHAAARVIVVRHEEGRCALLTAIIPGGKISLRYGKIAVNSTLLQRGKFAVDTSEKRMVIAARLKAAREQAGLTQGQVARILGLHRPSVSELEAGRRSVSAEELAILAETYGVSVDWLLNAQDVDPSRVRYELAARKLSNMRAEDLDQLLELLASLKRKGGET
jgi:transcriptional regulator with XRE-family HTH domain